MENLNAGSVERLRLAPLGRSVRSSRLFDFDAELAQLRAEAPGRSGHRQATLFHRTPVAHVLFAFDPGSGLKRHATNGLVSIHVIDGRLIVDAEDRSYELRPGQLLVLNPNVVHAVHAVEASGMLLTVTSDDGP